MRIESDQFLQRLRAIEGIFEQLRPLGLQDPRQASRQVVVDRSALDAGIVATAVYTFLLAWNEFLFALTLTKSMDMRTVPIGIELLMGQHAFEWNEMMAMSVLGSLPLLLLYLFAQRYFLAGMTAGSVKA